MIPGMYRVGECMCVHSQVSLTTVTERIENGQVSNKMWNLEPITDSLNVHNVM